MADGQDGRQARARVAALIRAARRANGVIHFRTSRTGIFPVLFFALALAAAAASPPRAVHRALVAPVADDRDRTLRLSLPARARGVDARRRVAHRGDRLRGLARRRLHAGATRRRSSSTIRSRLPNGSAWPYLNQPLIMLWASPPTPRDDIGEFRTWGDMLVVARVRAHRASHASVAQRVRRGACGRRCRPTSARSRCARRAGRSRGTRRTSRDASPAPDVRSARGAPRFSGSGRSRDSCRATSSSTPGARTRAASSRISPARRSSNGWSSGAATRVSVDVWRRLSAKQNRTFDEAFAGVFGEAPAALYGRFTADVIAKAAEAARVDSRRRRRHRRDRAATVAQHRRSRDLRRRAAHRHRRSIGDAAVARRDLENRRRAGHRPRASRFAAARGRSGGRSRALDLSAAEAAYRDAALVGRVVRESDGFCATDACCSRRARRAATERSSSDLYHLGSAHAIPSHRVTHDASLTRRRSGARRTVGVRDALPPWLV